MEKTIREPAVAGLFYEKTPLMLNSQLVELFESVDKSILPSRHVLALIVPHAGYAFSGKVAASAYQLLEKGREWKRVFLIGSSHRATFEGASVYNQAGFNTPLGIVAVDCEFCDRLVGTSPLFTANTNVHLHEHSLEVQLPFLQHHLTKPFKIVPILLGTQSQSFCQALGDKLQPHFTHDNLFIISTDFSHYPSYNDAKNADADTADAIVRNSPEILMEQLSQNNLHGYHELLTSLCGWTSVLTLLHITKQMDAIHYRKIAYENSGDAWMGDKNRVVGYWGMAVESTVNSKTAFDFTIDEQKTLLHISHNALKASLCGEVPTPQTDTQNSPRLKDKLGAFVSLYNGDELRGCIGRFESELPLWKTIEVMTREAATHDYRFAPVRYTELDAISIEISILSPLMPIADYRRIELGRHGVYLKLGHHSGTFLPQVATKTGWSLEEFLGHLSRDKAGLAWDDWRLAELFIYEAFVFGEKQGIAP